MLEGLLSGGLAGILGGITGVIGSITTAVTNYKMQKLKNEADIAKGQLELQKMDKEKEYLIAEANANIQIAKTQTEGAVELEESKAFTESQSPEPSLFHEKYIERLFSVEGFWRYITYPTATLITLLFGFVEFLKTFMRPAITVYLIIMTTYITFLAWDIVQKYGSGMTSDMAVNIFTNVIDVIIYLTVTCISWYYADRRTAKFLMRLRDGNKK